MTHRKDDGACELRKGAVIWTEGSTPSASTNLKQNDYDTERIAER